MREAFGGTFTIQLILLFLAIYIAFIAVALNYAKAFRVKNQIINIIEQNEGFDFDNSAEGSAQNEIQKYLRRVSYYVNLTNIKNNNITYVKNICTLNSYLEKDIKSSFRIKEFETSRKIEGKKKKFKNAWKIIKMVE